jgi:hypothetical protein
MSIKLPGTPQQRKKFIESLATAKGGYGRETAKALGLPYPLPKGWKTRLIRNGYFDPVEIKQLSPVDLGAYWQRIQRNKITTALIKAGLMTPEILNVIDRVDNE